MSDETTGFDPKAVADVFGSEPDAVEVSLAPETDAKPEPKEPPKSSEAKDSPVSARIAAAKRAEAKAAQQRNEASAKERELQQRQTALEARAREQEERESLLKLMEEDPQKYFEVKKLGPKGIQAHLERLANGTRPEEVQERRQAGLEAEMERLKAEIARKDEETRQARTEMERREVETQAQKAYVTHIEENIDAYPHLTEEFHTPDMAIRAGYELLNRVVATDAQGRKITEVADFIAKHGQEPTNEQICKFLDAVAKERIEARKQNAWRKRSDDGGQPSGQVTRSPTVTGKPRTLSARDTSSRATTPSDKWTQEWADAESLEILRRGTA